MVQNSFIGRTLFAKIKFLALLLFLLTFFISAVYTYTRTGASSQVYAATSSNLNYQARLLARNGSMVPDGMYNLEFKLYNVSSGGTAAWTETRSGANTVRVVNGYLSVNLGDVNPFTAGIKWDQDHWLTMNVGGTGSPVWDGEMNPRVKLTSVPYAFQAKQAERLNQTQGANTGILDFLALTANRTINLPDKDGTLCIAGSADCVDVVTTGVTLGVSSNSGLEVSADGLRLLGGCTNTQFLRWNSTTSVWECSSGSGSSFTVRGSDGVTSTTVSNALEFGGATNSSDEFSITAQGGGVTRVRLGTKVLTIDNYTTTLNPTYVNTNESPAAGDVTGTFATGLSIGEAPVFDTSVTTPLVTANGGLTLNTSATAGADDLILQTAGTEKVRLLENGDLRFEKGTNDVTFSIAAPAGAPAIYTFSGASGTVLTTTNFSGGLDASYVNVGEAPAAGDITGSFSAGLTIGANTVALGTDTVGDYVSALGAVTGLTLSANSGEGSTPGLSVNYGSLANTAVQGNIQITCASGSGNLTGGGTVITLGSGGTCAGLTTNNAVNFSTSVTTPLITNTSGITFDAVNATDTTITINNTGVGAANLNLVDGGLQVAGTGVLSNARALSNLTGLSSSGTVTLSSLTAGGLVKSAAGTGTLSQAVAGTDYESPLTFDNGLTRSTNNVKLGGNLTGATSIGLNANTLTIAGTGTSAIKAASGGGLEVLADTASALVVRNSAGTLSYFNVSVSGNLVQVGSATTDGTAILSVLDSYNNAIDPTGVNGAQYYNSARGKNRCFENNAWQNCVGATFVRSFVDTVVDAVIDANTTNYWDIGPENNNTSPNITLTETSGKAVMGIVSMEVLSTGNGDTEVTSRVERGIGAVPTCGTGVIVGGQPGIFTSNIGGRKSSTTTFIDVPNTASQVFYILCSDTDTVGTTANITRIRITLQEVNNSN